VQRIRLLGLQGQLYDGESHHPEYVMLGAFDYAFWLVFFMPLICIAFMHDLKASEIQAQRAIFLGTMIKSTVRFWARRILLRWVLVLATFILPVIFFANIAGLATSSLLQVTFVTLLYSLFWTAISAIVSLRHQAKNANFNAMLLASIWLCICIILPNIAQLWLHHRYPVQEGSEIALQHRQLVHNAWDLPKTDTLNPFYKHYPQWANTPPVTGRFHWKWYYAFQHMADVNLANQVKQRENSLRLRDQASQSISYLLPSLWVQRQLENIAQSNVVHLLDHRQKITAYHTQLRHRLYPFLFQDQGMTAKDFANLPSFIKNSQNN
jgi:ABC-2 type transport system permease protein